MEEIGFQIQMSAALKEKCNGSNLCEAAVDAFVYKLEKGAVPEDICNETGLCTQGCGLFSKWPVKLPPQPIEWPTERRSLAEIESADISLLKPIFENAFGEDMPNEDRVSPVAHIAMALGRLTGKLDDRSSCGHNVTCKAIAFADTHVPLQVSYTLSNFIRTVLY